MCMSVCTLTSSGRIQEEVEPGSVSKRTTKWLKKYFIECPFEHLKFCFKNAKYIYMPIYREIYI